MSISMICGNADYFVIDSENLEMVRSGLFGYAFEDNISRQNQLLGIGSYVYISETDDKIVITQDFLGTFGLYYYEDEGYFAISNSFQKLLEHLAPSKKLHLNEDYLRYFVAADLCSASCFETMVTEITLLPRNSRIVIDKSTPILR